jgi:hypothetical protein
MGQEREIVRIRQNCGVQPAGGGVAGPGNLARPGGPANMRRMRGWRGFAVLAAWSLVACGGGGARKGPATPADVDPADAAQGARSLVQEIYADLRRGDVDGLQSVVAADVFVVGPSGKDVFVERSDAVVALGGFLRSGDRHKLTSRALKVVSSPTGHAAWASDSLEVDGVPVVLSAVLVEQDGLWNIVAVHAGRPPKEGTPGTRAALPGGVLPTAKPALALYRTAVADPERFPEQFGDGPGTTVLGPGVKDATRGPKPMKRLWKKRLKANPSMTLDGEPRAAVTADGSIAWIFANVSVAAGGGEGEPYRELAIYQRDGKDWKLLALHDSIAR